MSKPEAARPRQAGRVEYPLRGLMAAAALHYAAYVIMQTLALFAETRRGPSLPDLVLDLLPAQRQLDFMNSTVWLTALLFSIALLGFRRPYACINYLRVGAAVSLLRGIAIVLTSLGPPAATQNGVPALFVSLSVDQITPALLLRQWIPLDVLWGGSGLSAAFLSQDLFFSGHVASTFLLLLVVRRRDPFFLVFLAFHLNTVLFLFLTHEHYSIDILAAYFFVYASYVFADRKGLLSKMPESNASEREAACASIARLPGKNHD
ncbi:MAG: phosphatase PAP2 family protein [Spirochaetales bacterium]|nr:phosphatase PAP2 family protein [Leptospiraceae bacterium]MCP5482320.1 phosphatase PAP2 family protein [Spirochaetales bacterium]MCP5484241.1 phosphatase PAP2 family protein [Spirochaetales bacterium]